MSLLGFCGFQRLICRSKLRSILETFSSVVACVARGECMEESVMSSSSVDTVEIVETLGSEESERSGALANRRCCDKGIGMVKFGGGLRFPPDTRVLAVAARLALDGDEGGAGTCHCSAPGSSRVHGCQASSSSGGMAMIGEGCGVGGGARG
jgi:hypothetical protein